MNPVARGLVTGGVLLVALGLGWQLLSHLGPGFQPGRLPGDLAIGRGGTRFYFPLTTCVLLSVALSALGYLIRRFF